MKTYKEKERFVLSDLSGYILLYFIPLCISALCYIFLFASRLNEADLVFMKSGIISMLESAAASSALVISGALLADVAAKRK